MHIKVKICGIKNQEEIKIINQFSVEYIGFIFAKSKRQVTCSKVLSLRKYINENIKVVGVFKNEKIDIVNKIIKKCQLDIVQLHGNEDNNYCKQIKSTVWKSIAIKDIKSVEEINNYKNVDGILLDTYYKGNTGGTAKTFNWNLVKNISCNKLIILAGGLTPDNIKSAMNVVKPDVIDINSGVETNMIKDDKKIKKLFNNIKESNNE